MNNTIKNILAVCAVGAGCSLNGAVRLEELDAHPVFENVRGHENIEWSGAYAFNLTDDRKNLPRVLLVGDSICCDYQAGVRNLLDGKMTVSYWVSSYCLTSPGYLKQLEFYLDEAKYAVVHFNNGLHSLGVKRSDWEKGLRAAFALIRAKQPAAKIVWTTLTPLKDPGLTAKAKELNDVAARVVAEVGGIAVDELFAPMDRLDREKNWRDTFHYKAEAIRKQAEIVSACCLREAGVAKKRTGHWLEEAGIRKYVVGRSPEEGAAERDSAYGREASNRVFRIDGSKSLDEVNAIELRPGDKVLFQRGGVWRGQLWAKSGKPGHPIVYGAYGEGPKPIIQPSYDMSQASSWRNVGNGLWMAETHADADIGNIVFDHAEGAVKCAMRRGKRDELANDLDYWCDPRIYAVLLKSDRNPAERFKSIELCEKIHCIDEALMHDVTYENLALRYTAAHGIGGSGVKRVTVRGCDISWIGGGYLYYDKKGNGVRYGNGIEFWSNCEDVLVESNRVWECWDAGLTNQSNEDGAVQRNVVWRGNEVWNCEYSYEYWQQGNGAKTENVVIEGNVFRDAGKGWGHRQRWNPNAAHLMFYDTTAKTQGFFVRGNVFSKSEDTLFRLFNDWRSGFSFVGNEWIAGAASLCRFHGRPTKDLVYRYPDRLDQMHDDNLAEIESQGSGACVFTNKQLREFKAFIGER